MVSFVWGSFEVRRVLMLMGVEKEDEHQATDRDERKWTWWPTWYELKTHYFKEVGFLACLSQMIGATVFVSWTFATVSFCVAG